MGSLSERTMGRAALHFVRIILIHSGADACISLVPRPPPPTTTTTAATTTTSTEAPCLCGVPLINRDRDKIVGGQPATKNAYSWMVGLVYKFRESPFCGGSLITSNTVLTAAHCKEFVSLFRVHVGEHDVTIDDGEIKVDASMFIAHPDYDGNTNEFDFGIVRLVENVVFTKTVSPLCLPNPGQNYEQREAVVAGWGTLGSFDISPSVLYEVDLTTLTNDQCTTNTLYQPSDITANMICARSPGKDSCQGDSGGPLMAYEGGGRYFSVVGVVSWGFGCALEDAPGVYARVNNNLEWIQSYMEGETCPVP